jgi:Tfp pilus assembly protein PilF
MCEALGTSGAGDPSSAAAIPLSPLPAASSGPASISAKRQYHVPVRRLLAVGFILLLLPLLGIPAGRRLFAMRHLKIGRELLERYHVVEARPHLEACLRLWPNNDEVLLLLSRTERRAEDLAAAERYLKQYQRLHGRTNASFQETIFHNAAKGDTDAVARRCWKIVQENGDAASLAFEAMVQGYLRNYRLVEGHAALQSWLNRQPDNTQALLFLAGLRALVGQHPAAEQIYSRIMELDPEHSPARARLALIWMEYRKYAEAMPLLQQLRQQTPDNSNVLVCLARCLDHTGQQDEAEKLLDEVLAQHPDFGPALGDRGRMALHQGRLVEAETWLREAAAQEPYDCELRYQLVQCLFKNGKHAEAEVESQHFKRIEANARRLEIIGTHELPQRPDDSALHLELGRLLLEQGQTEQALHWLNRVLRADPGSIAAHRVLANYFQHIGDTEKAAFHQRFLPKTSGPVGSTPTTP